MFKATWDGSYRVLSSHFEAMAYLRLYGMGLGLSYSRLRENLCDS